MKAFGVGQVLPFEYVPCGGVKTYQLQTCKFERRQKKTLWKPMTTTMNEDVALGQLPLNFPFVLFTFHLFLFLGFC